LSARTRTWSRRRLATPWVLVLVRVGIAARAESATVEHAQGYGQSAVAAQTRRGEVGLDCGADPREPPGERKDAIVLGLIPVEAPLIVVEVLHSSRVVDAYGLQVAVVVRTDPDALPGGRDRER